jgi:hypothetical protein
MFFNELLNVLNELMMVFPFNLHGDRKNLYVSIIWAYLLESKEK